MEEPIKSSLLVEELSGNEEPEGNFEWVHSLSRKFNFPDEVERELLEKIKEETVPREAYELILKELMEEKISALTDALTGLPNSMILKRDPDLSFGNEPFESGSERRTSMEKPRMFLAMCDLDGFKKVNDIEGHLAGNDRLIRVANVIYGAIRQNDIAIRLGGDEFGIIFKDTDDIGVIKKRLEMIRTRIEGLDMGITMSAGVASSEDFNNFTELYKAADEAMYQSKHNGRNQVTVYSKLS